ncbi:MAG: hypothetical protein FJ147_12980 [Deltaproteobacteria bacterium]|nr:hypothetical protein [Deltaproteobacteria bacterium]
MTDSREFIRASSSTLELSAILVQPTLELLGVSVAAANALAEVGIKTIFDLGTSNLFATAASVLSMTASGGTSARFGLV